MSAEYQLSTADLAETDQRSRDEVPTVNREAVLEMPANASAPMEHEPADVARREAGSRIQRLEARAPLFPERDVADLRKRWSDIQTTFVDEPRQAVERGDSLVADVMKRLTESFANERANLERQWDRGDNVTTEDLRMTFRRYRSFFDRLLSV